MYWSLSLGAGRGRRLNECERQNSIVRKGGACKSNILNDAPWFSSITFERHIERHINRPWRAGLCHRLDHAPDLLEDLGDLCLADDERRRERERVADGAEHQVLALERAHHRAIAAPAD